MIIWITGQPGSGKTSLGKELAKRLDAPHIDGKAIWEMFHRPNDIFANRVLNVADAQQVSSFYDADGRNVVVSMVSPYRNQREEFKRSHNVLEVHVYADSDPERPRQEHKFEGYEPPLENALFFDTTKHDVDECARAVLERAGLT